MAPHQANTMTAADWIPVTWMPHTAVVPTSHVQFSVVSPPLLDSLSLFRVRVTVHGMAGQPLTPVSATTSTSSPANTSKHGAGSTQGSSHLRLPLRWRDLPRDAYLHCLLLGPSDEVVAQSAFPLFTPHGRLKTGLHRTRWRPTSNDAQNQTPYIPPTLLKDDEQENDPQWRATYILDTLQRIQRRQQSPTTQSTATAMTTTGNSAATTSKYTGYSLDQIRPIPWLDELQQARCQQILEEQQKQVQDKGGPAIEIIESSTTIPEWLHLDLPTFDIPILYEETFYPTPSQGASGTVAPLDWHVHRQKTQADPVSPTSIHPVTADQHNPLDLVAVLDYENEQDNPAEDKYRTLAHDLLRGLVDPALKPDRSQREQLAAIIDSPSYHLSREEKDLLWRFRFSLVDNRKALTKFLLAVDWTVDSEVVQAAELLEQWRKRSPIEVTDALKLLGKNVAFSTSLVRSYAIDTLAAAPDSELRLYLLQLVQALKYENTEGSENSNSSPNKGGASSSSLSSLANFLVQRAAKNFELANFLYWYLKVELQNPTYSARYRDMFSLLEARLSETEFRVNRTVKPSGNLEDSHTSITPFKSIVDSVSKLGHSFRHGENDGPRRHNHRRTVWDALVAQDKYITGIMDTQLRCRDARGKRDAKESQLKASLAKEGFDRTAHGEVIPLPSTPNVLVNGLKPDTAKMFKSALYPALIEFKVDRVLAETDTGREDAGYKVIVKTGDDLRQDQLIIMMIQLMDGLLKHAALDMCLTPYSVIAMSPSSGLVEFVDGAMPISMVLGQYNNSILNFFQEVAPEKGAAYDVKPSVLSTYVRSCAGYCVLTYLLGVGDRHLDNILLRESGHFFHIDFGFVFGRDPKPLPPAFRLTREMVDGMGGIESTNYRTFVSLACQAFNVLRRSAGLVLNLLHLMGDAGIEDLSSNPSGDVDAVIARVEERFRLDLNDEQAERYFTGLINDCLSAIAPRVMEIFHSFSVARR